MNVKQTVPLMYVADIETSRQFYCQQLGFDLERSWEPEGKLAWCRLSLEGAALMLQQAESSDRTMSGVTIYFLCQDADAIYADLKAKNVDVSPPSEEFYGMNQVFVRDPDGCTLCFENPVDE